KGLHWIARRIHRHAAILAAGLEAMGYELAHDDFFDTLRVVGRGARGEGRGGDIVRAARERSINLRTLGDDVIVSLDETVNFDDLRDLLEVFGLGSAAPKPEDLSSDVDDRYDERFARTSTYLTHPVFNTHHSETEMLRYLHQLEAK